jgi:predicted CoA-binding protein
VSTLLQNLHRALHPRVVAVVGARKVDDYMWLRNMSTFSGGPVYAVNIDPNEIPGIEAWGFTNYARLTDIPEPVDFAVIAVPRRPGRTPGRHDERPGRCVDVHGRLCGNRGRGRAATPTDDHDHGA